MKPQSNPPRIVAVASAIAQTQSQLTKNLSRITSLETELSKLEEQNEKLTKSQTGFQREMDKLASGTFVQT